MKRLLPARFDSHSITDSLGRRVSWFVSKRNGSKDPQPLVLYIQGSGCHSVFRQAADGKIMGGHQNLLLDSANGRVRVMVVEKPGVLYLDKGGADGTAIGCRRRFLHEHTLERWSTAILSALRAARQLEGINPKKLLLVGHSEGGIVAARVAALFSEVTHLALFSSSGPTQLFDLLENERKDNDSRAQTDADRRAEICNLFQDIRRRPNSSTRFAWGHPYCRWSSFLNTSVLEEVLRSSAKVRLVHGLNDAVVPVAAANVLMAELIRRERDVSVDFRESATHSLATATMSGPDAMYEAFSSTLMWFFSS